MQELPKDNRSIGVFYKEMTPEGKRYHSNTHVSASEPTKGYISIPRPKALTDPPYQGRSIESIRSVRVQTPDCFLRGESVFKKLLALILYYFPQVQKVDLQDCIYEKSCQDPFFHMLHFAKMSPENISFQISTGGWFGNFKKCQIANVRNIQSHSQVFSAPVLINRVRGVWPVFSSEDDPKKFERFFVTPLGGLLPHVFLGRGVQAMECFAASYKRGRKEYEKVLRMQKDAFFTPSELDWIEKGVKRKSRTLPEADFLRSVLFLYGTPSFPDFIMHMSRFVEHFSSNGKSKNLVAEVALRKLRNGDRVLQLGQLYPKPKDQYRALALKDFIDLGAAELLPLFEKLEKEVLGKNSKGHRNFDTIENPNYVWHFLRYRVAKVYQSLGYLNRAEELFLECLKREKNDMIVMETIITQLRRKNNEFREWVIALKGLLEGLFLHIKEEDVVALKTAVENCEQDLNQLENLRNCIDDFLKNFENIVQRQKPSDKDKLNKKKGVISQIAEISSEIARILNLRDKKTAFVDLFSKRKRLPNMVGSSQAEVVQKKVINEKARFDLEQNIQFERLTEREFSRVANQYILHRFAEIVVEALRQGTAIECDMESEVLLESLLLKLCIQASKLDRGNIKSFLVDYLGSYPQDSFTTVRKFLEAHLEYLLEELAELEHLRQDYVGCRPEKCPDTDAYVRRELGFRLRPDYKKKQETFEFIGIVAVDALYQFYESGELHEFDPLAEDGACHIRAPLLAAWYKEFLEKKMKLPMWSEDSAGKFFSSLTTRDRFIVLTYLLNLFKDPKDITKTKLFSNQLLDANIQKVMVANLKTVLPSWTFHFVRDFLFENDVIAWYEGVGTFLSCFDGFWTGISDREDEEGKQGHLEMLFTVGIHWSIELAKHRDIPIQVIVGQINGKNPTEVTGARSFFYRVKDKKYVLQKDFRLSREGLSVPYSKGGLLMELQQSYFCESSASQDPSNVHLVIECVSSSNILEDKFVSSVMGGFDLQEIVLLNSICHPQLSGDDKKADAKNRSSDALVKVRLEELQRRGVLSRLQQGEETKIENWIKKAYEAGLCMKEGPVLEIKHVNASSKPLLNS